MKKIDNIQPIYLEEYDVHVNTYLTYAQIQQIINGVLNSENWAIRQQNIDMLLLYHVTDIKREELENTGHDLLLQSGLIDKVKNNVKNYTQVLEGLSYTESIAAALNKIVKTLPSIIETKAKQLKKDKISVS